MLWCFLWGHKYWEWIPAPEKNGKVEYRIEYNRCLRCDKLRDKTPAAREKT